MRFKYYLRGIGIGISFATLILTICFYYGRDRLVASELTDEEIIEKASALGMVMPEDETLLADEVSDESDDGTDADLDEISEEDMQEDTLVSENRLDDSDSAEVTESDGVEETVVTYVPFTVKGGQSSEIVSANLKKAGLVDSADSFNKYISSLNVDNLIQAGTFYVKQGSTYDDIVALLVNKEKRSTTPPKE